MSKHNKHVDGTGGYVLSLFGAKDLNSGPLTFTANALP